MDLTDEERALILYDVYTDVVGPTWSASPARN